MKKNLKKFFAVALAVAMVAAQLVVPAVAANGDYCNVCGNNAVRGAHLADRDLAATCNTAAYEIYECDYVKSGKNCAGTIAVWVAPADPALHVADGIVVPAVPSDCVTDGNYEYETCAKCGDAYLINGVWEDSYVDDKDGHNYVPAVTSEDCVNDGYTTWTCSVCGDSYVDSEVPAHGHDMQPVAEVPATCKEPGVKAHNACTICGLKDKTDEELFIPVAMDHNLHLVEAESQAPTCTVDGWNHFECDEPTCKYYSGGTLGGIDETITAKHTLVLTAAKAATCLADGHKAYKQCSVCNLYFASTTSNTNNKNAVAQDFDTQLKIAALGHKEYAFAYVAPTCTTQGYTDGIACANGAKCDFDTTNKLANGDKVLIGNAPIAANGHSLVTVLPLAEDLIVCEEEYCSVEHKACTVCNKLFAADTDDVDNVDAEPIAKSTVYTTRQHIIITRIAQDGGCIAADTLVDTCTHENCDYVKSYMDTDAANIPGHDFEFKAEVPADCVTPGTKAHNECKECGLLFAADADKMEDEDVDAADLVINALGHDYQTVEAKNPTYNAAGATAGKACTRCDDPDPNDPSVVLPELRETVNFYYTVEGVAGAKDAVNSGYVTLKIYFDVLADDADEEEYASDVLANIFGVKFALSFDDAAFDLRDVTVAPGLFEGASFTKLEDNMGGLVTIVQDMAGETKGKEFRGEDNLFATLTFQVDDDITGDDFLFEVDELVVTHPEEETYNQSAEDNILTVETPVVAIDIVKLGDINGDTKYDTADILKLSQQLKKLDADYVDDDLAVMDMDKDGIITNADMVLLRAAAAGNFDYKDIEVDPNAPVEAA